MQGPTPTASLDYLDISNQNQYSYPCGRPLPCHVILADLGNIFRIRSFLLYSYVEYGHYKLTSEYLTMIYAWGLGFESQIEYLGLTAQGLTHRHCQTLYCQPHISIDKPSLYRTYCEDPFIVGSWVRTHSSRCSGCSSRRRVPFYAAPLTLRKESVNP